MNNPMIAVLALALAGGTVCAAHASTPVSAPSPDDAQTRIIGGKELTQFSENPGTVGIHVKVADPKNTGFVCGGTRIAPEWVLTAKHCARKEYGDPVAVTTNTLRRSEGPKIAVAQVVKSPRKLDLMLLKLADPKAPGVIATMAKEMPANGSAVSAYGWGYTTSTGNHSTVLKRATGTVARLSPGKNIAGEEPFEEGLDVVFAPGDGLCWKADSGGPLMNAAGQLVGTSSWSNGKGTMAGECGYQSVAKEAAWIAQVTGVQLGTTFPAIPDPNPVPTGTEPAPAPAKP